MSDSELAKWLSERARDWGDDHSGPHLTDVEIARLVENRASPTAAARSHLAVCAECREVVAATLEGVGAGSVPQSQWRWRRVAVPFAVAAAVLAGVLVWWPRAPDDSLIARGASDGQFDAPMLTVEVVTDGRAQVLEDGAELALNARLSFRYGNAAGQARTLTVLGWDGERVHWYYPDASGKAAFPLESAAGVGLPFDIVLDAPHQAGPLTILYGFDVEPDVVAGKIVKGAPLTELQRVEVRLRPDAP